MATAQAQPQAQATERAVPLPAGAAQITSMIEPFIANAKPVVEALMKLADVASPWVNKGIQLAGQAWVALQPYHPLDFAPLLIGLLMIFLGGNFPVTIAAIEAFRLTGWNNTKRALQLLWREYQVGMEASRKDDQLDENKDGIADVKQIDTKELISRKIRVFMKACDPQAVSEGMQGVTSGTTAVIATLRLQFAQTIALGVSLGDIFTKAADQVVRPALERALPKEYHKWIGVGISYACRSVAVSIAWWLQRILSALHSAIRGAELVILGVSQVCKRYNIQVPVDLSPNNPAFPPACSVVGGIGLYFQLVRGFALPFPLNILLLPLRMLEWALYYVLAYAPK